MLHMLIKNGIENFVKPNGYNALLVKMSLQPECADCKKIDA